MQKFCIQIERQKALDLSRRVAPVRSQSIALPNLSAAKCGQGLPQP
jgi:hypothetical protein